MATLTWDKRKKRYRLNWTDASKRPGRCREFYKKSDLSIAQDRLKVVSEYEVRAKRGLRAYHPKSFAVLLLEYDSEYLVAKSVSHRERELKRFRKHIMPFFGDMEIGRIGVQELHSYIVARRNSGAANKTIRNELTSISSVFNFALDGQILSENPIRSLNQKKLLPRLPRRVGKYVSDVELRKFLSVASPECAQIILFLRETGMRAGEVFPKNVSLTKESFDMESGVLRLNHTAGTPLKGKSDRIIPLTDTVKGIVNRVSGGPIFSLNRHGFKSAFYKALNDSCLKFTPHDLRHTFTSVLADSGMDPKTISIITGHSTVYIMNNYIHPVRRDLGAIKDKMNHALSGLGHPQGTTFSKSLNFLGKNMETRGIEPLQSSDPIPKKFNISLKTRA